MTLNGLPWKWTEIILSFLRLHPSTAFQTLVDYDGYSISSKGFLPTVADIMIMSNIHPFSSLIPKIPVFTLAISCLTTFNLPWFTVLTFLVPMQYCSLQYHTWLPSPVISTTGWFFLLWLLLFILSGVIFPLISSSILANSSRQKADKWLPGARGGRGEWL